MKSVLIDAVALQASGKGISRYLKNVVPALLQRSDNRVSYHAALTAQGAEQLSDSVSERTAIVEPGSGTSWEQFGLPRLARNVPCHLIFRHAEVASIVGPATFLHVPEDPIIRWRSRAAGAKERARRLYERAILKRSIRRAAGLIFSTNAMAESLLTRLDIDAPFKVRPLGVDPTFIKPTGMNPLHSDGDPQHPYVFHLGSSDPRDQTVHLVDAYMTLTHELPQLPPLVLAGDLGSLAADVSRVASADAGRVRLLGRITDDQLGALYRDAVCCLCPTSGEGFGLQPLEALASGSAVVTSETSSSREVLGPHAIYLRSLDAAGLRRAMEQVSAGGQGDTEARIRFARSFDWEVLVAGIDEDVRRVLHGAP